MECFEVVIECLGMVLECLEVVLECLEEVKNFYNHLTGLTVLTGGSENEKIKAAFALYDVNGDGFISKDEMVQYLTSVYKVLYECLEVVIECLLEVVRGD